VTETLETDVQLAKRLGVSRRQIHKLRAMGKLPREIRINRSLRWKSSDLDAWILNGCRVAEAVRR